MKYYLDGIVVVEGKEDVSYLSSFIDSEYVTTNGYVLPEEEIDYLNEASKYKRIIVLTDPDKAGRNIEEKLKSKLHEAVYLNVEISKCNRGQKDGIAECEQEEILKVLGPFVNTKKPQNNRVLQENSLKITLSDKNLRRYISHKYHLGKCNNKTLFKRLETLQISEQQLCDAIKEYNNGN